MSLPPIDRPGLVLPDGTEVFSRACAWCSRFESANDEAKHRAGARISHSLCPACNEKMEAEIRASDRSLL